MSLPVQRYYFNFAVQDPLHLNFYSGSMLRGCFGVALKQITCMTRMENCKQCMLYRSCTYPMLFETPPPEAHALQSFSQIPPPYVIEPPPLGSKDYKPGETLSFSMVLIGQAIKQLPLIIFAWQRALAYGLGKTRSKAKLVYVTVQTAEQPQLIYSVGNNSTIAEHQALTLPVITDINFLSIHIKTPLRIQKEGQILSHNMTARDFIMSLVRRYYLLEEFHTAPYQAPDFSELAELAQAVTCETHFKWCDWVRYSKRQQQKMVFGGVLGELKLTGDLTPFLSMLVLGQWLHVGNKTTFGMGNYRLTSASSCTSAYDRSVSQK